MTTSERRARRCRQGGAFSSCSSMACGGLVLFACAGASPSQFVDGAGSPVAAFAEYARLVQLPAGEGRARVVLQTSVRVLEKPRAGPEVVLIAMHHMSTREYFRAVEEWLRGADVVVCEGVTEEDIVRSEAVNWVARYQAAVSGALGLFTQGEWEATARDRRWRAIDARSVADAVDEDPSGILSERLKKQTVEVEEGAAHDAAARERLLRTVLAEGAPSDAMAMKIAGRPSEMARHKAMSVGLRALIDGSGDARIVVLYGAIHAYAIEGVLRALGFRSRSQSWLDALEMTVDVPQQPK